MLLKYVCGRGIKPCDMKMVRSSNERPKMAKRHYGEQNPDMKRYPSEGHMEEKDGAMIHNDEHKFANLPTEVMMKPYEPCAAYMDFDIDDTIKGIDRQQGSDNAARKRGFDPHKY